MENFYSAYFNLHIMHPDEYPIFDQNVYRAMHYMQTGTIKEIPSKDRDKQSSYINEYLPLQCTWALP